MKKNLNEYIKKTYVNINSNDRLKEDIVITEKIKKEKIILEIIDIDKIKIYDENHNLEYYNQILFYNIIGDYNNKLNINNIGGIPISYINYNNFTKKPIFNITIINKNSYIIKLNINIDKKLINIGYKKEINNIIIEIIKDIKNGYISSSNYKIPLPKKFSNIKKIKLISLEMSNSQNLIRSKIINNKNNEYIENNNYIYWINKTDKTNINNYSLFNEEKTKILLDNNLNNIPNNWISENIYEKTFYEHLSNIYLNKIKININILKYKFINFLLLLKEKIIEPINTDIIITQEIINKLNNGYLIKFINNNITYILYLYNIPSIINNENYVRKFYIDSFYDENLLLEFIYNFTNYNKITKNYNTDLNINFLYDTNINIEPINIYAFIKYYNLTYNNININNNIILNHLNIKNLILNHIILLLNEIKQLDYNNYITNTILIKLQYEFINYLKNLLEILLKPLNDNDKIIISNSYLINFNKNNINYYLYLIDKPNNYITKTNIIDYYLDDLKNIENFINFIKLYTDYDINTNNYNIENNFFNEENNYIVNTYPLNIYGYLKNISQNNINNFIYNNENVNYIFIKSSFLKIIKKIIEEIHKYYINNYNLLENNINLKKKKYWKIPIKIDTDIYNISQQNIIKDYLVETNNNNNDICNIKYLTLNNLILYSIYPIYSKNILEGNYQADDLFIEIKNALNNLSIKKYDYYSKIFIDNINYNNNLLYNTEIDKHDFDITYNDKNNIINLNQYKTIYSFSSLDKTDINSSGPFITNDGYPYIFIKHKNHNLYTGNFIKISGASSIFNINSKFLNKEHYIYTHNIYRCTIRHILPLETGNIDTDIYNNYYIEGNTFINYSNFKSNINNINRVNDDFKTNIGTNEKNLLLDYDLSIYELISSINNNNILGRIINIRKNVNTNNYILDYALLSNNNFKIGNIFKSQTTNSYFMIIPSDWTSIYLPKIKDIITNNNINNDIIKLDTIVEGYSIKTDIIPNKTTLTGIGGFNINIKIPVLFKLLFSKKNTISNILGYQNIDTDFNYNHTNTYIINQNNIEYSYLESNFNEDINQENRYVYIKTLLEHNYNVGDIIYINNHLLNYSFINTYNIITLYIEQYEPFISWYNNLDYNYQILIQNSLSNDLFIKYKQKGIIIYYNYFYTNKQIQDLGNMGISNNNNNNNNNFFNYKQRSIPNFLNLKPNSYIYIIQNQNSLTKLINNEDIEYKTGLRDGYYKILNNLPCLNNSYYNNYFNNTNSTIIECDYVTFNDINNNNITYSETTISNSQEYTENILEGYINKGCIKTSNINTNIIGNTNNYFDLYKTKIKNYIDSNILELYFPILYTTQFYLNFNNNLYYINNQNINTINIYKNINYIIDISDFSLLNHNFIISNKLDNEIIINNNNIFINNLSGINNSYISIFINYYDNISNLYLINTDNNLNIITFNIIELNEITYNIDFKNNNFIFENNNSYFENFSLHIQFGYKYILQFSNINIYNNFIICTYKNYNNKFNSNYFTYDDINYRIIIILNNNNFPKELYYHYNNLLKHSGRIIFNIYYFYNIDKSLLINSNYIDNINHKIIDNNISNHIDLNIIDDIFISNYYFTIYLKKNTILNISYFIYPYLHYTYLYENVQKNNNIIKINKTHDIIKINYIDNNILYLNSSNKHLIINHIIIILNNIPNTNIKNNSEYYIIFVNSEQNQIKLGNIFDKSEVQFNSYIDLNNTTILFKINSSYNFYNSDLHNKSIKINYLQSKSNLLNINYNNQLSILNNNISLLNITNNIFYNIISSNLYNITELNNISWTTPYGSIRIIFNNSYTINYIKLNFSNNNINNNPAKIYLYYIENNNIYYINNNLNINNYIIEHNLSKTEFLIYIESYGLSNNIYSELHINSIDIGYFNNITNNLSLLNNNITNIKINNIINTYNIPIQYLDNNTYNESNTLLLNQSKSSIIHFILDKSINIKYYKISLYLSNHSITIDNITYNQYYEYGKITTIQLFGSNNINFINEIEIIDAKYVNLDKFNNINSIEKTFHNDSSFKYYRFKFINNFDFFPYSSTNYNNINDIYNYNFNINISGITIGILNNIDYNNLYIEDINYIDTVLDNNNDYITLQLKYNLLNNHLLGENIVISDPYVSHNLFTTQNLIIYGEWYTRIFYQGYNTIYNYFKNSKTIHKQILYFNQIHNSFYFKGNSTYTIIYSEYLDIYLNQNKTSITNNNIYNITTHFYKKDDLFYSQFTFSIPYFINNDNKFILSNYSFSNYKIICFHDSFMNEGIPIIQEYLTNNIHIQNMNGFYIPEINYYITNNNNTNNNNYNNNIYDFNYYNNKNYIKPLIDNNYNTSTYPNFDLIYKSDQFILNNIHYDSFKNGFPIYGYYNSTNNWSDSYFNNKYEFYTNFYSILIKGKILGFNGNITNKINNKNNIINESINGFNIIDINYDDNNLKKFIKLNLKIENLPIKPPFNYISNINNLQNDTIKNKYILGYGGQIHEKKLYKIPNFSGQNYIYLSINKLNKIFTTNHIEYFSKIILSNDPGTTLYDTFINSEIVYDDNNLLDELDELQIKFIDDNGKLYNFNNSEHSFVFEITEILYDFDK